MGYKNSGVRYVRKSMKSGYIKVIVNKIYYKNQVNKEKLKIIKE